MPRQTLFNHPYISVNTQTINERMINRNNPIDYVLQQCRSTWAYTQNTPVNIEFLMKGILLEIQKVYNNPDVNIRLYSEPNGRQFKVVYIRFQVMVPYKGNTYNVLSQVLFPPSFCLVPPIFAVINNDDNRFQVNQFYFKHLLPDGTYEAKLLSSGNWNQSLPSFIAMFNEFCSVMSVNFPFFATQNPLKNNNLPMHYHLFYNDPTVKRPFDVSLMQQNSSPIMLNLGQTPSVSTNSQMNSYQSQNIPSFGQQTTQDTTNRSMNSSFDKPQSKLPTSQAIKEALGRLKSELDSEGKTVYENIDFLLRKRDELMQEEEKVAQKKTELEQQIKADKRREEEMKVLVEKSKFVNPEGVENFVEFSSEKDEHILRSASELKAMQETEIWVENVFMEGSTADVDTYLMKINVLWRKEFDKRLKLKYISQES